MPISSGAPTVVYNTLYGLKVDQKMGSIIYLFNCLLFIEWCWYIKKYSFNNRERGYRSEVDTVDKMKKLCDCIATQVAMSEKIQQTR